MNEIHQEVKLGRNYVRKGDPVRVKLPGKSQFRTGFRFVGYDPRLDKAIVWEPTRGHEKFVGLDGIQRQAVTRGGERVR